MKSSFFLKKISFIQLVFATLSPVYLFSQDIASGMSMYSEYAAPEKLHIQTDRSVYRDGETIFFKLYALSGDDIATLSKTVYIDWYDEKGKLLLQSQAPLLLAGAKGSFTIPTTYAYKSVSLKAYTRWMLNFDTALVYNRLIKVDQPVTATKDSIKPAPVTQVQLYPEGGFSVADITNRLAFKATDQLGNPVPITATVKMDEQVIIDSIKTQHDGMGVFALKMKTDGIYSFNWIDAEGHQGSIPLQAQKQFAAVLSVTAHANKAVFTIERNDNITNEFKNLHLLVHRNYALSYKLDINMVSKTSISSEVLLTDLPDGIVQFTLFNASWVPVAERVIYLKGRSQKFIPTVSVLRKDLSKKGLIEIEINVPDTFVSNMSAAVTELNFANTGGPNIFSDLLVSSELKGKINDPAYYLNDVDNDSLRYSHLDLIMLTNGHRRYDWEQILSNKLPVINHPADDDFFGIKGKIASKRLLKSDEPVSVNVILQSKDSSRSTYILPVDKKGQFQKPGFLFYDTARLYYSINTSKLVNNNVIFQTSLMSANERAAYFKNIEPVAFPALVKKYKPEPVAEFFYAAQDEQVKQHNAAMLKEVTIKSRVKTTKEVLDDFYTSGMYSGDGNNYSFDVEGDITAAQYPDIYSYLQTRVPGFQVAYPNTPQSSPLWYLDVNGNPGEPALLLDEIPVNVEAIRSVSMSSIAYAKAFRPPFLGTMLNGFSGVIAIYTKKGYSPVYSKDNSPGLNNFLLEGYTRFKEFIQPDYADSLTKEQPNNQPTVYWNPFILTDKANPAFKFSFYNNDISKRLCLVLEGINTAGQLTRVVKIIE